MADPASESKSDSKAQVNFRMSYFILRKLILKVKNTYTVEAALNLCANDHLGRHEMGVSDYLVIQNRADVTVGRNHFLALCIFNLTYIHLETRDSIA